MSGSAKMFPHRSDHVPRDQQRQRHQHQADRSPRPAARHGQRDGDAEGDLDGEDHPGEHELAPEGGVEPLRGQDLLVPLEPLEEEDVVAEGLLEGVVHHRHHRDEGVEGHQGHHRRHEPPGPLVGRLSDHRPAPRSWISPHPGNGVRGCPRPPGLRSAVCPITVRAPRSSSSRPGTRGCTRDRSGCGGSRKGWRRPRPRASGFTCPPRRSSTIRWRPRSSTFAISTAKPSPEKRTNSGRTPISSEAASRGRPVGTSSGIRSPSKIASPSSIPQGRTFMPGEPMKCPTKVCFGLSKQLHRGADLHHGALVHHDHGVGEGERLGLVVGHVDHGDAGLAVDLLELRPKDPLHLRVDDRQRLVEHDHVHVGAHEAAAEGDLLLVVGAEPRRAARELAVEVEHGPRPRAPAHPPRRPPCRGCARERRGFP